MECRGSGAVGQGGWPVHQDNAEPGTASSDGRALDQVRERQDRAYGLATGFAGGGKGVPHGFEGAKRGGSEFTSLQPVSDAAEEERKDSCSDSKVIDIQDQRI